MLVVEVGASPLVPSLVPLDSLALTWDGFEVGAPVGPVKLVDSSLPLAQASSSATRATGEARRGVFIISSEGPPDGSFRTLKDLNLHVIDP